MTRSSVLLGVVFSALASTAMAQSADQDLIAKGKYVATAADCAACHTAPHDGIPYAGGYAIESPMGAIISTNITPSKEFGIGNWTEEQFTRAVREGVAPSGHLYPAMPYTAYSKITDADMHALWAYFRSLPPVDAAPAAKTELAFPFNQRMSMIGWNLLFADGKPTDPAEAAEGAAGRGEYVATALAHCQTCHTPRNALMAEDNSQFLAGGDVGGWHAPNITSDPVSGIGAWSTEEIVQYLRDGAVHGKAQAAGPMAEAISLSLRHLSDADLNAVADYLKSVPAIRTPGQTKAGFDVAEVKPAALTTPDHPIDRDPTAMTDGSSEDGQRLYLGACASCHQPKGAGTDDQFYPSLTRNVATGGPSANNLVMVISKGLHRETNNGVVSMPAFEEQLTEGQIASVANYVLANFGNSDLKVSAEKVREITSGGPTPWLVQNINMLMLVGVAVALLVVIAVLGLVLSRRRKTA